MGILCIPAHGQMGGTLPRRRFSELQDEFENIVIGMKIAKDAEERKQLLRRMSQLLKEADAAIQEQPQPDQAGGFRIDRKRQGYQSTGIRGLDTLIL